VAIQLVLVNLLAYLGVIRIGHLPLPLVGAAAGGFIFGLGMVFAAGCASGVWYKIGEGQGRALFSALGLSLSAYLAYRFLPKDPPWEVLTLKGDAASLPSLLGAPAWVLLAALLAASALWLRRQPDSSSTGGLSWRKTGLAVGLLAALIWVLRSALGDTYGMTVTFGAVLLVHVFDVGAPALYYWDIFFLLGIPLGAFLGARAGKEFAWRPPTVKKAAESFAGGLMLGLGAMLACGCTVGHGVTGLPILSAVSFWAMGFITLGAWAGEYIQRARERAERAAKAAPAGPRSS
jgi:hypothetical protein